jgi:hypothetical protein
MGDASAHAPSPKNKATGSKTIQRTRANQLGRVMA